MGAGAAPNSVSGDEEGGCDRLSGGIVCENLGTGRVEVDYPPCRIEMAIFQPFRGSGVVSLYRFDEVPAQRVIQGSHTNSIRGPDLTVRSNAPSASSHSSGERMVTFTGRPTRVSTSETAS